MYTCKYLCVPVCLGRKEREREIGMGEGKNEDIFRELFHHFISILG